MPCLGQQEIVQLRVPQLSTLACCPPSSYRPLPSLASVSALEHYWILHQIGGDNFVLTTVPKSEAVPLLRLLFSLDVTPYHLMPPYHEAARAVPYKKELFSEIASKVHLESEAPRQ